MADVYYPGIAAGDAASITATGEVKAIVTPNALYRVYELDDLAKANPLPILTEAKLPSGPTGYEVPVGALPIFPDVYVVSPNFAHRWVSGELSFRRDSQDAKDKAVADALAAAQLAAANAGAAAEAEVAARVAAGEFKGENGADGKDGSNVVPTKQAVADALADPDGAPRAVLSATIAGEIVEPLGTKIDLDAAYASFPRSLDALRAKSALSVDFVERDYRANGVKVAASTAFRALDPAALDSSRRLKAYKAATNLMPGLPLTGAALGLLGSGGALPTNWQYTNTSIPKTVMAFTASGVTLRMGPSAGGLFGGVRLPEFTPPGDLVVAFDIEITNLNVTDSASVTVTYQNPTGGALSSAITTAYTSTDGPQRVYAYMPDPGGSRRLQIDASSPVGSNIPGMLPDMKIENFVYATVAQVGTSSLRQPPYFVGSLTKTTAILAASNGDYVLVADTVNNGVVRANVTAAGGTGVDITDAFGGFYLVKSAYLVPVSQYNPDEIDGINGTGFASARAATSIRGVASLGLGKVLAQAGLEAAGADSRRSVQVALARPGLTRFDLRPGDIAAGDGPTQERAELIDYRKMPFGVDVWFSESFRILEYPWEEGLKYCLLNQLRYTNDPGDTSALSPDFSTVAYPLPNGRVRLQVVTRADPSPTSTITPVTNTDRLNTAAVATTVRYEWEVSVGELASMVGRLRFGKDSLGYLQLWVKGVEVFNKAIPLGYNRIQGPSLHFGAYRNPHTHRFLVMHANVECETTSLLSRVTKPLPL